MIETRITKPDLVQVKVNGVWKSLEEILALLDSYRDLYKSMRAEQDLLDDVLDAIGASLEQRFEMIDDFTFEEFADAIACGYAKERSDWRPAEDAVEVRKAYYG